MQTRRPFRGRTVVPAEGSAPMTPELLRSFRALGALPAMAGGQFPVQIAQPDALGGGFLDTEGRLVVDDYLNPPSEMPDLIRRLSLENEDYWIEEVFTNPGITVETGALIYTASHPADLFLPAGHTLRPRAPGTEAARISTTRRRRSMAYAEDWSFSLEVTDEARAINDVMGIQDTFQRASNSLTDILQNRGEQTLADFLTLNADRTLTDPPGSDWAAADPIANTTSTDPRPTDEFARVRREFREDKTGLRPDVLIVSPEDEEHLNRIYGGQLAQTLQTAGLRVRSSVRREPGERLYVRAGQVGALAWQKPITEPVYERLPGRWTDAFHFDCKPVFVARGADAMLRVVTT